MEVSFLTSVLYKQLIQLFRVSTVILLDTVPKFKKKRKEKKKIETKGKNSFLSFLLPPAS